MVDVVGSSGGGLASVIRVGLDSVLIKGYAVDKGW